MRSWISAGGLRPRCSALPIPTCTQRSVSIQAPDISPVKGLPPSGSPGNSDSSARAALAAMGSRARVMAIPHKRTERKILTYLTEQEVDALLAALVAVRRMTPATLVPRRCQQPVGH